MKRTRRVKRPTPHDRLDQAVEAIMNGRAPSQARIEPRLAAILRTAMDLRDLPEAGFKARLAGELAARAGVGGRTRTVTRRAPSAVPAGYNSATTCLVVRDGERAIAFYRKAFGARELMRLNDLSGHLAHAEIMIGDTRIALAGEDPRYNRSPESLGGSAAIVQLYVADADRAARRAVAAGAKTVAAVADQFYGDRAGRLADPFGHLWNISTRIEEVSEAEMQRRLDAMEDTAPAPGAPAGFHSITPYLQVEGAARLVDFLKRAFGAEELLRVGRDDGLVAHAQMRVAGSMVELADATAQYPPNPTALWLFVDDADAVYARALKAGATSLHAPADQDYGDREASVTDPFGNHWYIATHRADAPALPREMHGVTPYLHPIGAAQMIDFMREAFNAREVERHQDDAGAIQHAKIAIGDSIVAMGEAHGPYQPMPPALHLYVGDTDATYRRAVKAGAAALSAPADLSHGDRGATVKDPFGNVWYLATRLPRLAAAAAVEPAFAPGAIMPFVYLEDPAAAFEFYRKVFGATESERIALPDGTVSHVLMTIGPTRVMLRNANTADLAEYRAKGFAATPHELGSTPLSLYLYVADADATFARAVAAGSKIATPIADQRWGDRCGSVQDLFGHIWHIATPLRKDD